MLHAANSKPRKNTPVTRCSIKINDSKSQSESIKDRKVAVNQAESIFRKYRSYDVPRSSRCPESIKMKEDEVRVAQLVGSEARGPTNGAKKNVPASQRVAHPNLNYQKKKVVELWEALIDDTARSYTCLLLGVSETLCLLSLHLFNGLCVRVLNSLFSSGTSETLPSHPCLCLCLSPV